MRPKISGWWAADPEQLGQGKVGQRGVAGEFDQALAADLCLQPVALGLGALVAPDERGAQHLAFGVEHDAAMHLAGQADGIESPRRRVRRGHGAGDRLARSSPPVLRLLLGPADMFRPDGRVLACRRGHHQASPVYQDGPRASRPYIDSQKHPATPFVCIESVSAYRAGSGCCVPILRVRWSRRVREFCTNRADFLHFLRIDAASNSYCKE